MILFHLQYNYDHEFHEGIGWETNQKSKHTGLIIFLIISATGFGIPLPKTCAMLMTVLRLEE